MKKNAKKGFIPKKERPWFYDKNGVVRYVIQYPITIKGKAIKEKPKTFCGGLRNVGV